MTDYRIDVSWEGNTGTGTASYPGYEHKFRARAPGKTGLVSSAAPRFRGDPRRHDPEELLMIAVSSCHMLSYLALCARAGVNVVAYDDTACGRLAGPGFAEIVLRPCVTVAPGTDHALAEQLHERAHAACMIAASCAFPVRCEPTTTFGAHPTPRRQVDVAFELADRPGALAALGEAFAQAGISVRGGGGFVVGERAIVHFLIEETPAVAAVPGFVAVRDVVTRVLDQDTPGQLGAAARAFADAGVNIACVYSDHDNQLVVVVDEAR